MGRRYAEVVAIVRWIMMRNHLCWSQLHEGGFAEYESVEDIRRSSWLKVPTGR